jgi:hypothetical protein
MNSPFSVSKKPTPLKLQTTASSHLSFLYDLRPSPNRRGNADNHNKRSGHAIPKGDRRPESNCQGHQRYDLPSSNPL